MEYITFKLRVPAPKDQRKTDIWDVVSTLHGDQLGEIKWFGRWHQYTFWPVAGSIYNRGCLELIAEFIWVAMADRQKLRKS